MTAYRGSVTIRFGALVDGTETFSASTYTTMELVDASLAGDGTLSAIFSGSGLPFTVFPGGTTASDVLAFPSTPFSTPITDPVLPFGSVTSGLTIVWNQTISFDLPRTTVTVNNTGTFSGVLNGVAAAGTVNAIGFLTAATPAYSIAPAAAVGPEGNSGTTAYTFTVTRLGDMVQAGAIAWQVAGTGVNPATASDFAGATLPSGTLTFEPFETQKTLTVEVQGDEVVEPDEGFAVLLASAPGEVIATTPVAQGVIGTDDFARISIAALVGDVAEGAAGASTPFTFTLSRSGNMAEGAGVSWAVQGTGSRPAEGSDFVGGILPSGTVSFLPGESSQTLTVLVAGDDEQEGHDGFAIALYAPTLGVGLGTNFAPGLIINDDGGTSEVADSPAPGTTLDMGDGYDLVRFAAARSTYKIGGLENHIHLEGPDGVFDLANVDWLKFGDAPAITWQALFGQPETEQLMRFLISNGGGSQVVYAMPIRYAGPLDLAYEYPGTESDDTVAGTSLNDFVNLSGGNDAADMGAGNDIIDGGGGSNFLTGGSGIDQFFIDGRFGVPVWSCITDWVQGESVAVWGWQPGVSVGAWGENAGLPGYLGATFYADIDGNGAVETAVTLAGHAVADMSMPYEMYMGDDKWVLNIV